MSKNFDKFIKEFKSVFDHPDQSGPIPHPGHGKWMEQQSAYSYVQTRAKPGAAVRIGLQECGLRPQRPDLSSHHIGPAPERESKVLSRRLLNCAALPTSGGREKRTYRQSGSKISNPSPCSWAQQDSQKRKDDGEWIGDCACIMVGPGNRTHGEHTVLCTPV